MGPRLVASPLVQPEMRCTDCCDEQLWSLDCCLLPQSATPHLASNAKRTHEGSQTRSTSQLKLTFNNHCDTRPSPASPKIRTMSATLPTERFDPIFPVRDLSNAEAFYRSLGFDIHSSGTATYSFAIWPSVGCIHLNQQPDVDPRVGAAAAYLYVEDADALASKWQKANPSARIQAVVLTDYGRREGAIFDVDNNLIRFGSKAANAS